MLPKSRLVSVFVLGLGIAMITAAVLGGAFVHRDARLPAAQEIATLAIVDPAAEVASAAGEELVTKPVTMQRHLTIADPFAADQAGVRIGYAWVADDGDPAGLIDASIWGYRINRITGLQISPTVVSSLPGMPPAKVELHGLTIKFPADIEQTTVQYVDPTLRATFPMNRTDAFTRDGRDIDVWTQTIPDSIVGEFYASPTNTGQVTTAAGVTRPVLKHYAAKRELHVDHRTGIIIAQREQVQLSYVTVDGEERFPTLRFDGINSDQSQQELLDFAATLPTGAGLLAIRILLAAGGALAVILGLIGVFGLFGRKQATRNLH
ncbi:porin PorA family protein [Corynebacterium choanae]|uniref:DUF3068 domain-containing protein n=1 Tax=Corynebacterium choanae TaxID=1862358 RepID=A0A3G6J959_9CORY|nr:porin PorA family protein [Corynebacterium choanae]AZA14439.1 hypothetical protein CCHOA_10280 [Corynebacterium choanae]